MKPLGQIGEDLAAAKYKSLGFRLLERNYAFRHGRQTGEIDLIFIKDQQLVFVEVKTRSGNSYGTPFEAVDIFKQRKLVKTVKLYLMLNTKYRNYNYRIDVAAVNVDNPVNPVIILQNAIEDLD